MKIFFQNILFFICIITITTTIISAQEPRPQPLDYGISINYPPLSIPKQTLLDGNTLVELNKHYKPSWIRSHKGMTVRTIHNGKERQAFGPDDTLTKEQKNNMLTSDSGSSISISVKYIPDNTLKNNEIKEYKYSFVVDPDNKALFPGGEEAKINYLRDNIVDKIPSDILRQYQLAVINFTIDESGHVTDPYLFWTSEDESVDALLMETICKMPTWKPASYEDGTKVNQSFSLTVGDNYSCVMPMLNLRNLSLFEKE
jgi:hypothetical protein